ncbi:MAG TPA: hypothetical protein PKV48_08075 [Thermodesulfobacteriota bacterium]|nr:hypothetical protein [Thermodesulfobacteriota bacterium]
MLCIKRGWVVFLLIFVFILPGCDSSTQYIGTYVSVSKEKTSQMETILILKDDDNGLWTTNEKEVPFRWSVKGKEIRLHTKEGGVIIGKILDDTITVTLPGNKLMTFKKKQPY